MFYWDTLYACLASFSIIFSIKEHSIEELMFVKSDYQTSALISAYSFSTSLVQINPPVPIKPSRLLLQPISVNFWVGRKILQWLVAVQNLKLENFTFLARKCKSATNFMEVVYQRLLLLYCFNEDNLYISAGIILFTNKLEFTLFLLSQWLITYQCCHE